MIGDCVLGSLERILMNTQVSLPSHADVRIIPATVVDGLLIDTINPGLGCYPWDITPRQYLQFAAEELTAITSRSLINAIGHAKRAIHAHVDFLLYNCGRCQRDCNFPKKLQLLQDLGIIAPTLLNKYN